MDRYGLLVIGGGPAGISAAAAYVKAGGPAPVLLLSADSDGAYERPPLSKSALVGPGEPTPTPLGVALPRTVEQRLGATVTSLDLDARTASIGADTVSYERLVVATGARPLRFPDADDDAEVHVLRTLDDARRLAQSAGHARTAVVIGSGFIGCEAAASLARRGLTTTLITPEESPQEERLGTYAAEQITSWLTDLGVEVRTGLSVNAIRAPRTVHLDDGHTLAPDLLLVAIGVEPQGSLLDGTGVQLHNGRIVADQRLLAAPGVWVAGDVARGLHETAGRPLNVEHWGDALAMGDLAGRNAAAGDEAGEAWSDIPGFWSTIGEHTLKYAAWGDGHESLEVVERPGRFTIWYADAAGVVVGVLTYNADDDYERGERLIASGTSISDAVNGVDVAPAGQDASTTTP